MASPNHFCEPHATGSLSVLKGKNRGAIYPTAIQQVIGVDAVQGSIHRPGVKDTASGPVPREIASANQHCLY